MSDETMEDLLRTIRRIGKPAGVEVGGGEPTLHPKVVDFVKELIRMECMVNMSTNGSNYNIVMRLMKLAEKNNSFNIRISMDKWHDTNKIHRNIFERALKHNHLLIGKLTQEKDLIAQGRAAKNFFNNVTLKKVECCCKIPFIKPDGTIRYCGCANSPVVSNLFDRTIEENAFILMASLGCGIEKMRKSTFMSSYNKDFSYYYNKPISSFNSYDFDSFNFA